MHINGKHKAIDEQERKTK